MQLRLRMSSDMRKHEIYQKYLGISFGRNVRILGKPDFGSEPYLIEIGDDVTITEGVRFVTHDGGVGIFRNEHKGINVFGRIKIGNRVFIGINTIILPDVEIGDNVVIGAGSVVTRSITGGAVVAGVPARVIKSIDEYKKTCLEKAVYIHSDDRSEREKEILKSLK